MDLGCPCSSPEISLDLLGYSNKSINFRDLGCPCSSPEISRKQPPRPTIRKATDTDLLNVRMQQLKKNSFSFDTHYLVDQQNNINSAYFLNNLVGINTKRLP